MRTQWIHLVAVLGISLVAAGCGNLASRADAGCQMVVRDADGWSLAGVKLPVSRPPDGAMVTIGAVTYSADQAEELSRSVQELDQARLHNCATLYDPEASQKSDAEREPFIGRVITAADQMNQFGVALKKAKTVDAGLAAGEQARRAAALIRSSAAVKKPNSD